MQTDLKVIISAWCRDYAQVPKWPRVAAYISLGAEMNHLGIFKDGSQVYQ